VVGFAKDKADKFSVHDINRYVITLARIVILPTVHGYPIFGNYVERMLYDDMDIT